MKRVVLALALLVLAPSCASSDSADQAAFERGLAAYGEGDYAAAFEQWLPLAERGHVLAQYDVALMFDNGQGVPRNDAEALRWYGEAADSGHAGAQNNLGLMYAAGQGVARDDATAVAWWRKAAQQGYANAQRNLAVMYANGWGTPTDHVQAHLWFDLAAMKYPPGEDRDAAAIQRDRLATTKMSKEQVDEARRLARSWAASNPTATP